MAITQRRSKKKVTGGKYLPSRKKRKYEKGNLPTLTKAGEKKTQKVRTKGGSQKTRLLTTNIVNLLGKDKKLVKAKIISIVENNANRHFVRRNIITKGCVVETDMGKAKITSRPGQEGTLNGVLI